MNSFSRKIIAGFSLVMLGIHPIAVTAGGTAQCVSQPCCCTEIKNKDASQWTVTCH